MIGYYIGIGSDWVFDTAPDADATAFLAATSITDETLTNATQDLTRELKNPALNSDVVAQGLSTDSIWDLAITAGGAIYPDIGGNATSHSRNLLNPADSDAAFRTTWSG